MHGAHAEHMYVHGTYMYGTIIYCNSYIHTQDVTVGEKDSWMQTPTYMTIPVSMGHECPL